MFVEKLTRQDFEEILKQLDYKIDYNPTEKNLRYPIDILTNSVMIRCLPDNQDELTDDVLEYVINKMSKSAKQQGINIIPNIKNFYNASKYKLIVFEDFWAYPLEAIEIDEEEQSMLLGAYMNYMSNKFPEYQTHLDMYVENLESEDKEPNE